MATKSALDRLQQTVVGTVRGVAKDPIGTARGTFALGRAVAGRVAGQVVGGVVDQVTRTVKDRVGGSTPPPSAPAPLREPEPPTPPVAQAAPKPSDVARVVEQKPAAARKAPPAKKAPAKKAPAKKAAAKKSTPSAKLPPKKAD